MKHMITGFNRALSHDQEQQNFLLFDCYNTTLSQFKIKNSNSIQYSNRNLVLYRQNGILNRVFVLLLVIIELTTP